MSWLQTHLTDFVEPHIGRVLTGDDHSHFFSPSEMAVIKNAWRSVKKAANGRPILLAGRDVYVWYVLACRERFPVIFRPDISRLTVEHVTEDYSEHLIFDTGFVGSIPKLLKSKHHILLSDALNQYQRAKTTQVFPTMTGSRSLALKIERTPKYWRRAYERDGLIRQDWSEPNEFRQAALLTIDIYKDSSPSFVERVKGEKLSSESEYAFFD